MQVWQMVCPIGKFLYIIYAMWTVSQTIVMLCCELSGTIDGVLFLKQSHAYYHQIQGQLHITGYTHCDLVVWTTIDLQVVRVAKDVMWTENINKLIDFYFNVFLPCVTK